MRLALACLAVATAVHGAPPGWRTYRSERYGFALSHPPDTELRVYLGGVSGDLLDAATGRTLLALETWPADLCPRQPAGTTARALGVARAGDVTQADGDDGSSSCGPPVTVKEWRSASGVPLYELTLTCTSERGGRHPVRRHEGRKGPTFFADVSTASRPRVLMLDPAGNDPRSGAVRVEADRVRAVLDTLTTFPIDEPDVVCIDELRPGTPLTGALGAPR